MTVSVSFLFEMTSHSTVLFFCTAAFARLLSDVIICDVHWESSTAALAWVVKVTPVRGVMSHCLLKAAFQWFFQLSHVCWFAGSHFHSRHACMRPPHCSAYLVPVVTIDCSEMGTFASWVNS